VDALLWEECSEWADVSYDFLVHLQISRKRIDSVGWHEKLKTETPTQRTAPLWCKTEELQRQKGWLPHMGRARTLTEFEPVNAVLLNPIILLLFREEWDGRNLKIQVSRHVVTETRDTEKQTSSTPSHAPMNVSGLVRKLSGGGDAKSLSVPRSVRRTSRSSSMAAADVCLSKKSWYAKRGCAVTRTSVGTRGPADGIYYLIFIILNLRAGTTGGAN